MIEISYKDLKSLRDNSQLIPGQQYRIIDYVTTCAAPNARSAGHQFDIIVTADDINVLNENARAIQHEGDTYFANSNLAAWELKYCIDNYTDRFSWADTKPNAEISLEVDDFFKNRIESYFDVPVSQIPDVLKFYWWDNPNNGTDRYLDVYSCNNLQLLWNGYFMCLVYPLGTDVIANPELCYPSIGMNAQPTEVTLEYDNDGDGIVDKKYIPTSTEFFNGKGIIYQMTDEFNNSCPYDFKNIQFTTDNQSWHYTFYGETLSDASLNNTTNVHDNWMGRYIDGKQMLNNIHIPCSELVYTTFKNGVHSFTNFGNTSVSSVTVAINSNGETKVYNEADLVS